jgi:3-oxoacyl-[acyl-carrier-protein] synthase-3
MVSVESAQPDGVLTAAELGERFGRSADWIGARTGIAELRRAESFDEVHDLATSAGRRAIEHAGFGSSDVDLVITVSCSVEQRVARVIAARIAPVAAMLHVNIACSGFCYAIAVADGLIRDGTARRVLIVAVEHMTSLLDPTDLGTSIIFGDGSGAAILQPAVGAFGVGPIAWGSAGESNDLIACNSEGLLRMSGREVFRWALETAPRLAEEACARAGVSLGQIRAFVPHQANRRIVDAIVPRLDLEHAVVSRDISRSGNTSGASIPIALDQLLNTHPELGGELALLIGFGAGLSYAGQVLRLPKRPPASA